MKKILLVILVTMLALLAACSSALSLGKETSDTTHSFLPGSAQIIDKVGGDIPTEKEVYFVMKYEVTNLLNQNDSRRQWSKQMKLEAAKVVYQPIMLKSLPDQVWETSLLPNEVKAGYIVFTVKEGVTDFRLVFTFPDSGREATYEIKPVDKRIKVNVNFVADTLQQIERTRRIPVIGGILATTVSSPIRYMGIILVPEKDVSQLLGQTMGLPDEARKKAIENYLLARGVLRFE